MTLRDWTAGQCLAAAFGNGASRVLDKRPDETTEDAIRRHWDSVANAAFIAADAFLAARTEAPHDH